MSQDRGINLNESITVKAGGVTVTKEFAPEEFEVPAIRFELRSEHDEPVLVRLTDMIPEDFPMDGVGFHPDYDGERWTAYEDGRVEFERSIEPEGSLVTVYGIRVSEAEEVAPFLTEPYFEVAAGEDAEAGNAHGAGESLAEHNIDDIVPEESTGVVREFITGARDAVPGLDEDVPADGATDETAASADSDLDLELENPGDANDTDEQHEDLDLELEDPADESPSEAGDGPNPIPLEDESEDDHSQEGENAEGSALESDVEDAEETNESDDPFEAESNVREEARVESPEEESEVAPADETREPPVDQGTAVKPDRSSPTDETVAGALAAELQDGDVSEDDLAVLEGAFAARDTQGGSDGQTATQLRHLQGRVSELEAYADAFGEFIDENGTGDRIIEDVQGRMDDLESELEEGLERTSDRLTEFEDRLDAVDGRVEELADEQDRAVEAIEDDLREVRTTLGDVDADLADLRDDVDTLREWRERLGNMFTD